MHRFKHQLLIAVITELWRDPNAYTCGNKWLI